MLFRQCTPACERESESGRVREERESEREGKREKAGDPMRFDRKGE